MQRVFAFLLCPPTTTPTIYNSVYLEEPVRVASTTRINLEEPVRVASTTRIKPGGTRQGDQHNQDKFVSLSVRGERRIE